MRRRGLRIILALVVGAAAVAAAPTSAAGRVWTITPTPSPGSEGACLAGVSGDGGLGVWAVGGRGLTCDGPIRALIEHRAHGRWSVVPAARLRAGDETYLADVAALAPNDAWAVGAVFHQDATKSVLIEHWNGAGWTEYPTNRGWRLVSIARVPSTDHLWAVGSENDVSASDPSLAGYWDGKQWRFMTVPPFAPGGGSAWFTAVAAVSENDVWAVARDNPGDFPGRSYSEHWNGTRWTRVATPQFGHGDAGELADITNVPRTSQVWSVGRRSRYTVAGWAPVAERWSQGRWQIVPCPLRGQSSEFDSVIAFSPGNVWAVGAWYGRRWQSATLVEHYTDGRWTIVRSPSVAGAENNSLYGLAAVRRDGRWVLWAVGGSADEGAISPRTLALRGR